MTARRSRETASDPTARDASGSWRSSFLRMPYSATRSRAARVIAETFETACTWDGFPALHAAVTEAARTRDRARSAAPASSPAGSPTSTPTARPRTTASTPADGGAAPGRQWDEIKAAVSEALTAHGGTITHHHAVGRDHRPWYDRQRPDPFAAALRAAKSALDPAGILNPGVLLDP